MYDYNFANSDHRETSALEVALRARKQEKQMALMMANIRVDNAARRASNGFMGVLTSLLTSIKIF